jgi:hypothetical protein
MTLTKNSLKQDSDVRLDVMELVNEESQSYDILDPYHNVISAIVRLGGKYSSHKHG